MADMEQKAKELEVERKIQEAAGDKQAKETLKEQRRNEARIASVAAENKVREEELTHLPYHIYTFVHPLYMYIHHIYIINTPNTPLNTL